ncbi:HEPN domain-containing protein [Aquabacter sediminis]|uniref:HEPN domain-containing protein n=1 Tax=Aquabacter sediminis TaxID=3029197 RepID=UPI00237E319A|nr:HEPN domain-containing protein [Aquabacter sp. P-9]MDE1567095.1 HEPN domain-containing protein [Aquabacter sp. P-9]
MAYADDIAFVFSECTRMASLSRDEISKLPTADLFSSLPHPSGNGNMMCGAEANRRLLDIANLALSRSVYAGRIASGAVVKNLKEGIVQRFFRERRRLDQKQAERVVSSAVRSAAKNIEDLTHFMPCHLGYAESPNYFSIGPVQFKRKELAFEVIEPALTALLEEASEGASESSKNLDSRAISLAKKYYASFGWISEVKIQGCDATTSQNRAERMVQSALNCLHVLLGATHSKHMRVGGPPFGLDRRGGIRIAGDGRAQISNSVDWQAHGLDEGWWDHVNADGGDEFVRLMGIAVEIGHDLPKPTPLAQRFLDGATWFGEAVRDLSDASRLIKYVTAMERILITRNDDNLSEIFSERGAAILLRMDWDRPQALKRRLKVIYDLRSRLVHGDRSPLEPGLAADAYEAEQLAQSILLSILLFYREEGLRFKSYSQKNMDISFDRQIGWATEWIKRMTDTGAPDT